jgi:hypothetical protein
MFSAAVRAEQACRGSRDMHARRAAAGGFAQALSADIIAFISERDSAYLRLRAPTVSLTSSTAEGPAGS